MEASEPASLCGLCGQPIDERHVDTTHGGTEARGERREYVVVGRRGGIVEFQRAGNADRTYRTDAEMLAIQLNIAEPRLVGVRFSCWVSPAEYGTFQSDFKLIT
ncbi:hypothetical protein [Micromonospora sp. NPDC085948]|uniref:hypothetical protein n=1 Tax=Micromonospora sp. NPDC085948 TaxID=3155293 RepID=UPI003415B922